MKKFWNKFKQHLDKNSLKHLFICIACGLLGLYGVAFGLGASITKEYCDLKSYGHWCWTDISCDIIGLILGYLIRLIILLI